MRGAPRLGRLLVLLAACLLARAAAQEAGAEVGYRLDLTVDGGAAAYEVEPPGRAAPGGFAVPEGAARVTVSFDGGALDLDLADWGIFDRAHVVGLALTAEGGTYRVDVAVRHRDEGWEHYADRWRLDGDGVEAVRELLHPHDDEQPFTRSLLGVRAGGVVVASAADTVHGEGGSAVAIDLDAAPPRGVSVRYDLRRR